MFFIANGPKEALIFLSLVILEFPAAFSLPGQSSGSDVAFGDRANLGDTVLLADSATARDSVLISVDSIQDLRIEGLERRFSYRVQQLDQALVQAGRKMDSLSDLLNRLRIRNLELEQVSRSQAGRLDDLRTEARQQQERLEEYRSRFHTWLWVAGSILLGILVAAFLFLLLRSERTRQLMVRLKTEFKIHRKEQRRDLKRHQKQQRQEIKKIRKEQRRRNKQQLKEQRRESIAFRKKQRKELKDQSKKK